MTNVLVCRHGETVWNQNQILQGQLDSKLTAKGQQQALQLAVRAEQWNIQRVVTSPLGRARETASIVAQHLALNTAVWPDLQERGFGQWQGQPISELKSYQELLSDPEHWETQNTHSQLEPLSTLRQRFGKALSELQREYAGQTLLLISHGHIMEAVARQWQPTGILQNGSGFKLQFANESAQNQTQWQWAGWLDQA